MFYSNNKSNAALANICKPALQGCQQCYTEAVNDIEQMTQLMSDPANMKQFAYIIYDVLVYRFDHQQ